MGIFEFLRKTVHELVGVPEEQIRPESTAKELNLDMFDKAELVIDPEFETLDDLAKIIDAA